MNGNPQQNTDRELWNDDEGNSVFVNQAGGIGINVGGYVWVKTLRLWHAAADSKELVIARAALERIRDARPSYLPQGIVGGDWYGNFNWRDTRPSTIVKKALAEIDALRATCRS